MGIGDVTQGLAQGSNPDQQFGIPSAFLVRLFLLVDRCLWVCVSARTHVHGCMCVCVFAHTRLCVELSVSVCVCVFVCSLYLGPGGCTSSSWWLQCCQVQPDPGHHPGHLSHLSFRWVMTGCLWWRGRVYVVCWCSCGGLACRNIYLHVHVAIVCW